MSVCVVNGLTIAVPASAYLVYYVTEWIRECSVCERVQRVVKKCFYFTGVPDGACLAE